MRQSRAHILRKGSSAEKAQEHEGLKANYEIGKLQLCWKEDSRDDC
jgi:hypothetical protein